MSAEIRKLLVLVEETRRAPTRSWSRSPSLIPAGRCRVWVD